MEILFLLFYELTKLTEGLDDFQITKKFGVVKRNELFSFQPFISNPTVALPDSINSNLESEKNKAYLYCHLPSDRAIFELLKVHWIQELFYFVISKRRYLPLQLKTVKTLAQPKLLTQ